jgi:CRP/FNR family nitrogen fixation transcriptional regulator
MDSLVKSVDSLVRPVGLQGRSGCAALGAIGTVTLFERNDTIFSEGDVASHAYKVVNGGVRLYKLLPDGRRQIAEFILAGEYFGIDDLERRDLTAEAMSDTTAICYARTRLERLGDEDSTVRAELYSTLRHDLWAAKNHVMILGRQSASERIASFLVYLMDRRSSVECATLDLPMSRRDIADYLGLTIETVSRVFSALKRQGIIAILNRQQIQVRKETALRQACIAGEN